MKKFGILLILSFSIISLNAQYKNDNVLYRLVYLQDLCQTMNENPGALLLDVRSKGEYSDTSQYTGLNIGRFRNATNIPVQELGGRLSEIQNYKDQPIFVYCSHSQRSRRASKMLADSGFTRIFNVNSGFSATHLNASSSIECLLARTEMNTNYSILAPQDVISLISGNKNGIFLLDVRTDSAYQGLTKSDKMNSFGMVKGSVHIPREQLLANKSRIPSDKQIILIDAFGDESAEAASLLKKEGYKNVATLFDGIDGWVSTPEENLPGKWTYLDKKVPFTILTSPDAAKILHGQSPYVLVDVRSKAEFENQAKENWRNIGHLKNAINIPASELNADRPELKSAVSSPVIIYSFSSDDESYRVASLLAKAGFSDIRLMSGGLFRYRWTAHNIKGMQGTDDNVVDVPEANR